MPMHLQVHETLPLGVIENRLGLSLFHREASGYAVEDGKYYTFHFCSRCKGWIEGYPSSRNEHSLGMLSGRSGDSYHCRRCGHEISFVGRVS